MLWSGVAASCCFFFQAEDGIRDLTVTGVQTCALPISPVGEVLLAALDAKPGERILDLASGTGEPALTLARRLKGHANILGIDTADGMVRGAQARGVDERPPGISIQCMPVEQLAFNDNRFDRGLCRFGVM